MQVFVIVTVSLLNFFIIVTYIWLLHKKRISPSLAMWVFFTLAVTMSLLTYLKEGNFGFWDNVLNTTDLVLVLSVSMAIFIKGDKQSRFNRFDWWCLLMVGCIMVYWYFSQNHMVSNLAIQLVLVIAYFPVIKRMLRSKSNTEPFVVWIAMMLAPLISLLSSKGTLATIYAVRAFICTALLLLLMLRVEWMNRNEPTRNSLFRRN